MDYVSFLTENPRLTLFFGGICLFLLIILLIQHVRFGRRLRAERRDAVKRSRAVIGGQTAEQLAPFLPGFPCPPSDARFIGKPVDFIAFPGLSEGDSVTEILLIEVKTGSSELSGREKEVRRAAQEKRIRYVEYRVPGL